ncbi:MAG: 1-deoxy-D-xylulose-5-phosphate reductoisomerase [Elusimicrobia bacterium RIFOXYA2_FULL_50_26]|nr:MAG: 1-deoxy-D-xylulose-5-phosphate reductoisomerase [Elusimicrobia bacterium RIFOXYA2_FULL_50_26]
MKKIAILGSTGSIGRQAIDVVRRFRGELSITALAANSNLAVFKEQLMECKPLVASIGNAADVGELEYFCKKHNLKIKIVSGRDGLLEAARHPAAGVVLSAVVGSVGLEPLLAAIKAKKDIALANKEALVVAGPLIMREAKKHNVRILPVDSEHSAIFQCLQNDPKPGIRRILLTASGGPFYRSKKRHAGITAADALAHPTWIMGKKITIDSATLMNKGLEAIEAHHLFSVPLEKIEIVIHPQSIIHSMVEFADMSVLAQMSNPDMRLPIQYALTWPHRRDSCLAPLDLFKVRSLEFGRPDFRKFPCLALALEAGKTGGTMPAVMNAANEVAVAAFLERKIPFTAIAQIIEKVMRRHKTVASNSLETVLAADAQAREAAAQIIRGYLFSV